MKLSPCSIFAAAIVSGVVALHAAAGFAQSWIDWRTKDNLAVVNASGVEKEYVLTALNQPGGIYFPGDQAEVTLAVPATPEKAIAGGSLELVNVHNRNAAAGEVGFVLVTVAPKVLKGNVPPTRVKLDEFKAAGDKLTVKLPLPTEFGTYMLLLERADGERTFLGSVARTLPPVARKGDVPQIMAESGVSGFSNLSDPRGAEQLAATYERMGIKLVRWEFHWQQSEPTKDFDFGFLDIGIPALTRHHIKLMNTMGAQPWWTMPMELGPIPAVLNTENHISGRKFDAAYGKWVRALVGRYWKGGDEGLWAIEHYNEPWEPLSCAGWQSDSCRYRELLEVLSREAHSVAPGIKIAAACSVMNTEDKLTSDGSTERMQEIDLMTDHYVTPCNAYGPRVAAKYGKISGETETWGVCTEVLLPQFMTQFLAVGNSWVNPMIGDMPLEEIGRKDHPLLSPKPLVPAVAAWNHIIADRPFQRLAFTTHLPWLYQFGPDDDARFVIYGKTMPLASGNMRDLVWRQASEGPAGSLKVSDPDGALVVMDMEGNRLKPAADKTYEIPMTQSGFYLQSDRGAAYVTERVAAGKLSGNRQVEILPGTLTAVPSAGKPATLAVVVHNLRNAALKGEFKVASLLKEAPLTFANPVELSAGESTTIDVPVAALAPNGLPLEFSVTTSEATDKLQEVVRSTAIVHGTFPVDGDPAAWSKVPAVTVIRPEGNDTGNPIERAWLPFLEKRPGQIPAKHGEVRLAWDDRALYVNASIESDEPVVRDRYEGWDQDQYFYSAKHDQVCESLRPFEQLVRSRPRDKNDQAGHERFKSQPGYAEFAKYLDEHPDAREMVELSAASVYFERKGRNPNATFGDATFVYIRDFAPQQPFNGDSFQVGFDFDPTAARSQETHDLKYPEGKMPEGYQALPDTDYEFAFYKCRDGQSEAVCLLTPQMPRVHIYPRQPRGKEYPFTAKEGRSSVAYENGRVIYRAEIPWKSVGVDKPQAGQDFGLTFRFNASKGDRTALGEDLAATKSNGLSLHPYWSATPSCTVRWKLQP